MKTEFKRSLRYMFWVSIFIFGLVTIIGSGGGGDGGGGGGETPAEESIWYLDSDDDGYGTPNTSVKAETKPDGHVSDNTDCNDNDEDINPGVSEICDDNIDDDCDGKLDNGCVCTDGDEDGFYAESDCGTAIDCDDANENINPGAAEIQGDGIDQNCDGSESSGSAPVLSGPSTSSGPITLTWSYNGPPVSGFEFQISLYSDFPQAETETVASDVRSFSITIKKIYENVYFRIRAVGSDDYSNIVTVSIPYLDTKVLAVKDSYVLSHSAYSSTENTNFNTPELEVGYFTDCGGFWCDLVMTASYLYFDIDDMINGRSITKAILKMTAKRNSPVTTLYYVKPVGEAWDESTLTYNTKPGVYNNWPPPGMSDSPISTSWEVDITHIVQAWADGDIENHGIQISSASIEYPQYSIDRFSTFISKDADIEDAFKPHLELEIH